MMHVTSPATRQLLRETIIDELQVLPELLRKTEKRYYQVQNGIEEKRARLADTEMELAAAAAAAIGSKEEAARQAAYRSYTRPLQAEIRQAELEAARLKAEIDYLLRKMENYRVMAGLLTTL